MFCIFLVGTSLIQNFIFALVLKVYAGFINGSSIYTEFGFSQVAYTFWCMVFEVTVGSEWWCSVQGSNLCTSYSDLFVPVDWLNLIKFEWMVGSVVSEVQWLFDSVVQWLFYVRGFSDWLIQRLIIGFQLYQRFMIEF